MKQRAQNRRSGIYYNHRRRWLEAGLVDDGKQFIRALKVQRSQQTDNTPKR